MTITSMGAPDPRDDDPTAFLPGLQAALRRQVYECRVPHEAFPALSIDEDNLGTALFWLASEQCRNHAALSTDQVSHAWDTVLKAHRQQLRQREKRGGSIAKPSVSVPSRGEPTAPRVTACPPPLVEDADGYDGKPDPRTFMTEEELLAGLQDFVQWAGGYSSRQLATWSGNTMSHMTIHNLLAEKPRKRPPLKLVYVQAIIRACGADETEVQRWTTAWRRVRKCPSTSAGSGRNQANVISLSDRTASNG